MIAVLRYALLVDQGEGSAPEDVILHDRQMQVMGVLLGGLPLHRDLPVSLHPPPTPAPGDRLLSGWGRTLPPRRLVLTPLEDAAEVGTRVRRDVDAGAGGRGLGRATATAPRTPVGSCSTVRAMSGTARRRPRRGARVTARAGTSLDELMRWLVPARAVRPRHARHPDGDRRRRDRGRHPRQEPPRQGSWCDHVESLRLIDGAARCVTSRPTPTPEAVLGHRRRHGADRRHRSTRRSG